MLYDAVERAPKAKDAFEQVAGELGKTVGTVSQKYYNMERKKAEGSNRKPSKAGAQIDTSKSNLKRLETNDLVKLIASAKEVLKDRKEALAQEQKEALEKFKQEQAEEAKALADALKD